MLIVAYVEFSLHVGLIAAVVPLSHVPVAVYVPVPPSFTDDGPLTAMLTNVAVGGVAMGNDPGVSRGEDRLLAGVQNGLRREVDGPAAGHPLDVRIELRGGRGDAGADGAEGSEPGIRRPVRRVGDRFPGFDRRAVRVGGDRGPGDRARFGERGRCKRRQYPDPEEILRHVFHDGYYKTRTVPIANRLLLHDLPFRRRCGTRVFHDASLRFPHGTTGPPCRGSPGPSGRSPGFSPSRRRADRNRPGSR